MFNLACILRESVAAYPAKPVALWDGGRLAYAELDAASDRIEVRTALPTSSTGKILKLDLKAELQPQR